MVARALWFFVLGVVVAALIATLWFVSVTLPVRVPYWGEVEVLYEASRLREGLPLYVDPLVGASEHGEPPSRYYVTYPPLWTWIVSLVPGGIATPFARVTCSLAWFGSLAWLACSGRRESMRESALVATFVAGIWVLANFATIGRPDSIACALSAVALARVMRREKLDLVSVVLLVLVPWVKPTLVGLPVGTLLGAWWVSRRQGARWLGVAAILAASSVVLAFFLSRGALFDHVVRSNAQPFTWAAWLRQVPARLPFFAPVIAWAAWLGWRDRARASSRIGLSALAFATAWTLFALAKTGSSSNYWMEPLVAAVALASRASRTPIRFGDRHLGPALVALLCVGWADVASIRGAIEHARQMRADAAFVASLRTRFEVAADEVVSADEAGIELVANGRILTPTYQMVHLVRRGTYPAAIWIADLTARQVGLFVEHTGQLRLAPELEQALESHFCLAFEGDGFRVWKPARACQG